MLKKLTLLIISALTLASCRSTTEIAYLADAQRDSAMTIVSTYQTTVHPGDLLSIYVSSQTPESTLPFNQDTRTFAAQLSRVNVLDTNHRSVTSQRQLSENISTNKQINTNGTLVEEDGTILLPVLGKMTAVGLTLEELQSKIEGRLKTEGYINDAVVTVSPMNFRVSVVGEVAVPQELHVTGNRLTILEAIAMCGDLTMDAQRDNVKVIRSNAANGLPIEIDLTSKTLFDSEGYYLQTNDIVYIEPTDLKKRMATINENWPMYAAFWVAVGAAVVNIGRATVKLIRY